MPAQTIGLTGNEMSDIVVFHKSVIGAGHIAKKKPCQDYSICENSDGIQVMVVCDGHGGASYVRSNTGAKLAGINTRRILKTFAINNKTNIFDGVAMAVTAQPQRNPFIDVDGNKVRYEDLDETQQEVARQAQDYINATEHHKDKQAVVNNIINEIIDKWREDIEEDARIKRFTKEERAALAGKDLTKAYGCTVLAYLRTPMYWLAIQIGDGKIVSCDEKLNWSEPVPRDCECFLNRTTSLCDKSPEKEFRYAFSGKGDFPIAVFLNSDGVDGSFGNKDNLHSFYTDVIELFQDRNTDIQTELEEFLPKLSEQGNHDDMSIAGMVDVGWLSANEELIGLFKEERALRAEREAKVSSISDMEASLETIKTRLDKLKETVDTRRSEYESWWQSVQDLKEKKEQELKALQEKEDKLSAERDNISEDLKKAREELNDWNFSAKMTMADIEDRKKRLLAKPLDSSRETVLKKEANKNGDRAKEQPESGSRYSSTDSIWD